MRQETLRQLTIVMMAITSGVWLLTLAYNDRTLVLLALFALGLVTFTAGFISFMVFFIRDIMEIASRHGWSLDPPPDEHKQT